MIERFRSNITTLPGKMLHTTPGPVVKETELDIVGHDHSWALAEWLLVFHNHIYQ